MSPNYYVPFSTYAEDFCSCDPSSSLEPGVIRYHYVITCFGPLDLMGVYGVNRGRLGSRPQMLDVVLTPSIFGAELQQYVVIGLSEVSIKVPSPELCIGKVPFCW